MLLLTLSEEDYRDQQQILLSGLEEHKEVFNKTPIELSSLLVAPHGMRVLLANICLRMRHESLLKWNTRRIPL